MHLYSDGCPSYRCLNDWHFQPTTEWNRFEVPFVSTGTASAGLNFFVQAPGTVWIDVSSLLPRRYEFTYAMPGFGDTAFDLVFENTP